MTSITNQIFDSLQTVQCPGDFYATGTQDIFLPQLEVAGVGRIALPLLSMQAKQLVAMAEQAPYGRGQETLVDTDVRRTWQIDARHVTLKGKHWAKNLSTIVGRCAAYWQWANAYITSNKSTQLSFSLMTNILTAYPEISYFHSAYFDTVANAANVAAFSSVNLYNDP